MDPDDERTATSAREVGWSIEADGRALYRVDVPCEPFSPLDSCLCGIDTAAALDRTPGLEWRADDFMGEPEIVAWAKQ